MSHGHRTEETSQRSSTRELGLNVAGLWDNILAMNITGGSDSATLDDIANAEGKKYLARKLQETLITIAKDPELVWDKNKAKELFNSELTTAINKVLTRSERKKREYGDGLQLSSRLPALSYDIAGVAQDILDQFPGEGGFAEGTRVNKKGKEHLEKQLQTAFLNTVVKAFSTDRDGNYTDVAEVEGFFQLGVDPVVAKLQQSKQKVAPARAAAASAVPTVVSMMAEAEGYTSDLALVNASGSGDSFPELDAVLAAQRGESEAVNLEARRVVKGLKALNTLEAEEELVRGDGLFGIAGDEAAARKALQHDFYKDLRVQQIPHSPWSDGAAEGAGFPESGAAGARAYGEGLFTEGSVTLGSFPSIHSSSGSLDAANAVAGELQATDEQTRHPLSAAIGGLSEVGAISAGQSRLDALRPAPIHHPDYVLAASSLQPPQNPEDEVFTQVSTHSSEPGDGFEAITNPTVLAIYAQAEKDAKRFDADMAAIRAARVAGGEGVPHVVLGGSPLTSNTSFAGNAPTQPGSRDDLLEVELAGLGSEPAVNVTAFLESVVDAAMFKRQASLEAEAQANESAAPAAKPVSFAGLVPRKTLLALEQELRELQIQETTRRGGVFGGNGIVEEEKREWAEIIAAGKTAGILR